MSVAPITRRVVLTALILATLVALFPTVALTEDPPAAIDRVAEYDRLYEQCEQATVACNLENCNRYDYSGCLTDCRGCFDTPFRNAFFEGNWQVHPSLGPCALSAIEAYVTAVQGIQASYLERALDRYEQQDAEQQARETTQAAIDACKLSSCVAHCGDLGVAGRIENRDCVCDPLPDSETPETGTAEPVGGTGQTEEVRDADNAEPSGAEAEPPAQQTPENTGDGSEWLQPFERGGDDSGATTPEDRDDHASTGQQEADSERPLLKTFRIRPVSAVSVGELVGYVHLTYELQEVYDDGTTGRHCTLRFTGWGAMVGLPAGFSFAPGYQWSEMPVRSGRMRLEDFHNIKGYHSSGGGILGGWSGMHFGTPNDASVKRAETSGGGWNVGIWLGLDWTWGTWEIVDGPQ